MTALSPAEFHQRLLAKRTEYHLEHPFENLLYTGKLSKKQLQIWATNRFYYQAMLPQKDASIIANCPDPNVRRIWLQRICDQDGTRETPGGIEAWLLLGEGLGIERSELQSFRKVLPGVRFAVDAYVNFARTAPWQEAICSTLTELFAGTAHRQRLEAFTAHYTYVPESCLAYFKKRQSETVRDVDHALTLTLSHFTTVAAQERALEILQFKLDVLWAIATAVHEACEKVHD